MTGLSIMAMTSLSPQQKKDKIKRSQVQKQLSVIKKSLNLAPEDKLIAFSGETKEGKDELWAEIERVIGYEEPAKE